MANNGMDHEIRKSYPRPPVGYECLPQQAVCHEPEEKHVKIIIFEYYHKKNCFVGLFVGDVCFCDTLIWDMHTVCLIWENFNHRLKQ